MIEIIAPALIIGLILTAIAGPLGSFIVWGRMSYFGDTLAHSALLGVALGLFLSLDPIVGVIIVTVSVAILLSTLQKQRNINSDALLGIVAHGTLALGLVLVSLREGVRVDLLGLLFGDLLAVTFSDTLWVGGCALLLAIVTKLIWNPLLNILINSDLARAEGLPVDKIRMIYMICLALLVAIGMKVVGALLITALLIIPPAGARRLASTPEQMALFASLIGMSSIILGMLASLQWDTPAGPSIVLSACLLFSLTLTRGSQS
ncbi:MAG: metal ABC transporter permease [Pseudomonadales bacterium]|nr:metal ABC transporter permease [Pseudomonadales bacterium]